MLSICSLIITAYTFYNNSNILNLGTSLEFTDDFCVLSHPTLGQACLSLTQEEMEAQEDEVLWLTIWYKFSIYFVYKCVILIK